MRIQIRKRLIEAYKAISFAMKNAIELQKGYIFLCFLISLIDSTVPFLKIYSIKFIIDQVSKKGGNITYAISILIALFIAIFILENIRVPMNWNVNSRNTKLMADFQARSGRKIMDIDFPCLENTNTLNIIGNMWKTNSIVSTVVTEVFELIFGILSLIACIGILQSLSPVICIFLIIVAVSSAFMNGYVKRVCTKIEFDSSQIQRELDYYHGVARNIINGKEIRIFSLEKYFENKIDNCIGATVDFQKRINNKILMNGLFISVLQVIQLGIIYFYMIFSYIKSHVSIGDFSMYIGVAANFSVSINRIANAFVNIATNSEIIEKYYEFHKLPEIFRRTPKEKINLNVEEFEITFDHVWFKYPNANVYVLEDINLKINGNQVVSIVGENGAGKSTLIKLLVRLYEPTHGVIRLNGIDIRDHDYDEYIKLIAPVFQDFKLFAFTIRENLTHTVQSDDNDTERINEALLKSGIYEKVAALPNGIESYLYKGNGFDAVDFSGGELQKLAIARAFYKDSYIAILDEPTSSLDPIAEYQVYKKFNGWIKNKTAVYISHRMSSSKFSDKIFVIFNNRIIESGTHDELIELNGKYSEMYNIQAQYYKS